MVNYINYKYKQSYQLQSNIWFLYFPIYYIFNGLKIISFNILILYCNILENIFKSIINNSLYNKING